MVRQVVLSCLLIVLTLAAFSQTAFGSPRGRYDAPHGGIVVSESIYRAAGGKTDQPPSGAKQQIVYSVVPTTPKCDPTTGVCDPTKYRRCTGHPTDAQNNWIPFDVYISTDGGKTWPPDGQPTIPMVCLNNVVISPTSVPITAEMVRAQAEKLMPHPTWTLQPNTGKSLMNMPIIVAIDTPAGNPAATDETFPPFPLLGRTVTVRASVAQYSINFGDGTTIAGTDPGRHFDQTTYGSCDTHGCAGYLNHVYASPGAHTIGLTTTWHAQFQVGGGAWQDIPGAITTTSPAQTDTVVEYHTVLLNPDH